MQLTKYKRVLITGGVSLIGSHLVDALLAAGAEHIVLLDNFSLGNAEMAGTLGRDPRVRVVKGDILRLPELLQALAEVDGVFALAGYLTLPLAANPGLGVEVNVMGALNVLDAARVLKKKVVLASSISVYGDQRHTTIDERTPFGSHDLSPAFATYAATKLVGEHLGRLYAQSYGVEVCSARFSTVYGENQHARGVNALYILEAMQSVARGEAPVIPGTGEEAHDFIYAGDVARGCIAIMEQGKSGDVFNIASGVSTSVNEVVRMVLQEYGSDLVPRHAEDKRSAKAASNTALDISVAHAQQQLGWRAEVSVGDGIRKLKHWLDQRTGH
ncbi:GDP-mannose 4,6-dehydratase [Alcaligenaceae bacterium]|nr:GDP-mannose 4,6-dehydratase [Alcaligenaceae bacterium]